MPHPSKDLTSQINKAKKLVEVGGIYYHYKNPEKFYVVESVGFIENTQEVCVVYRALYDTGLVWVRTLTNFLEKVEDRPRFSKVS